MPGRADTAGRASGPNAARLGTAHLAIYNAKRSAAKETAGPAGRAGGRFYRRQQPAGQPAGGQLGAPFRRGEETRADGDFCHAFQFPARE